MATAAERTFILAVTAAEGVRQVARAAAFAAQAVAGVIPPANLAAYEAALLAADVAYTISVNSAANTMGANGISAPNQGPGAQTPHVTIQQVGQSGPSATMGWTGTLGSVA